MGVRRIANGSALFLALFTLHCNGPAPTAEGAPLGAELKPLFSVKELMEHVIDPQADFIFDAVAVDINERGISETKPTSDDDWVKVQRAAVTLAEGTNLLKIPRPVAPEGETNKSEGPGKPELSPDQIQAKLDQDRSLWNSHIDELRDEALKV